jgi:hypothetical protein
MINDHTDATFIAMPGLRIGCAAFGAWIVPVHFLPGRQLPGNGFPGGDDGIGHGGMDGSSRSLSLT